MKNIALTGASGVVGTRLREYFKTADFHVFGGDLRDSQAVRKFCLETAACDAFIHLAAIVPKQAVDSHPIDALDVNVRGTLNVLEGLRQLGPYAPWLFFPSSSHVYASSEQPLKEDSLPAPFTLYGLTKLQGEQWCQAYARDFKLRICIGRIFSFSDPLQPRLYFIPAMLHRVRHAEPSAKIEIPGINGKRDFITVNQICKTIELLFAKQREGVINIGSGVGTTLIDVVKNIAALLGRSDLTILGKGDIPSSHIAETSRLKNLGGGLKSELDALLLEMTKNAAE
ncbi:MAG TPA: NAD(P)-dependent oxidoreductase [Elusimicrobiota bacterium]|nr:NAD(P)-dependent oxidoreductase [Elusimicrobiota bacterium]